VLGAQQGTSAWTPRGPDWSWRIDTLKKQLKIDSTAKE
jgi:hypothetical protein